MFRIRLSITLDNIELPLEVLSTYLTYTFLCNFLSGFIRIVTLNSSGVAIVSIFDIVWIFSVVAAFMYHFQPRQYSKLLLGIFLFSR